MTVNLQKAHCFAEETLCLDLLVGDRKKAIHWFFLVLLFVCLVFFF